MLNSNMFKFTTCLQVFMVSVVAKIQSYISCSFGNIKLLIDHTIKKAQIFKPL